MKILLFADVGDKNRFYHVGDEAMLYDVHKWYKKRLPQAEITILSKDSAENPHLDWPIKRIYNRGYFFIMIFKTAFLQILGINFFNKKEYLFIKTLKKQDIIHFTGGGNITSLFTPWLYYSFLVIFLSRFFQKKIILTSQTIGPIWKIDRIFAFFILNLTHLITLRQDIHDKNPLIKYGVILPKIKGAVDAAYWMSKKSDYNFLFKKNRLYIGLSLHYWQGFDHHKMIDLAKKLLTEINEIKDIEVVLIPHVIGPDKYRWNDINLMKQTVKDLSKKIKVIIPKSKEILENKTPALTVKKITASVEFLISSRYHGTIFALSENIPTLSLVIDKYYQLKFSNLLEILYKDRLNNYLVDLNKKSCYKETLQKTILIIKNLNHEKKLLKEANRRLKKRQDLFSLDDLLRYNILK